MAADTEGLLKALAIEWTHVADVSLGGRIALALALAHPERINWLIVISTSAKRAQRSWWFDPLSLVSRWPPLRSEYAQPWYAFRRQRQASNGFDVTARLG